MGFILIAFALLNLSNGIMLLRGGMPRDYESEMRKRRKRWEKEYAKKHGKKVFGYKI